MRDAVHGEGVETDLFFHDRKALRHALHGGSSSAAGRMPAVGGNCCIPAGFSKANSCAWRATERPFAWTAGRDAIGRASLKAAVREAMLARGHLAIAD